MKPFPRDLVTNAAGGLKTLRLVSTTGWRGCFFYRFFKAIRLKTRAVRALGRRPYERSESEAKALGEEEAKPTGRHRPVAQPRTLIMYTCSMAKKIVVVEGEHSYVMMEDGRIEKFPLVVEYDEPDSTQTTEKK